MMKRIADAAGDRYRAEHEEIRKTNAERQHSRAGISENPPGRSHRGQHSARDGGARAAYEAVKPATRSGALNRGANRRRRTAPDGNCARRGQRTRSSRAGRDTNSAAMARGLSVQIAEVEKRKTAELRAEISERSAAERAAESPDGRDKARAEVDAAAYEGGSSASPRRTGNSRTEKEAALLQHWPARAGYEERTAYARAESRPASSKKRETAQVKAQIKSTADAQHQATRIDGRRFRPRFPTCSARPTL